jgi:hypothetical protein
LIDRSVVAELVSSANGAVTGWSSAAWASASGMASSETATGSGAAWATQTEQSTAPAAASARRAMREWEGARMV